MTARRPMGALEDSVMEHLWACGQPATPAEVQAAIGEDLAYTTVMTILTRLWQKGRLDRERDGRAYMYTPVLSEAQHRAETMRLTMERAGDKEAVLSSFVHSLTRGETGILRRLLEGET